MTDHDRMDRLQELILTRLQQLGDRTGPMSAREAARRSGGLISYESLRLLARGDTKRHKGRLTDRTVQGLAKALEVSEAKVYDAIGASAPGGPWEWPQRFERLGPSQRQLVEDIAAALLSAYEQGQQDAAHRRAANG